MAVLGPIYAASQAASGALANQLTNPANAVGSTEGNYATATPGSTNTFFGNYYQFGAGAFDGIPDGSTINSITLEWDRAASNASGVQDRLRIEVSVGLDKCGRLPRKLRHSEGDRSVDGESGRGDIRAALDSARNDLVCRAHGRLDLSRMRHGGPRLPLP